MRAKGKNIALYRRSADGNGWTLLALSLSCDVAVSCDMAEFSSFLSGRAKRFRAGRYSWTITHEALVATEVADGGDLLAALKSGERLYVCMSLAHPDGTQHAVGGWCLVGGWQESAPMAGMATYKTSFQGDGELSPL